MRENRQQHLERLQSLEISKGQRDFIVMYYLIASLKNAIAVHGKGDVLDIGCGNKPYKILFSGKNDKYVGCDIVQSSLNEVDVICPADNIPIPDASFDTILCTQVLEHVNNPEIVIQEALRLLRPDGTFILSIPFCWELHEEPYDFFRYSKYGIASLLERGGFSVLKISANGGKWAAIFQLNLNMIYSSFIGKKGIFRKAMKFLFIHLGLTRVVNSLAVWVDDKWFDDLLTLNYVVVAQKKL